VAQPTHQAIHKPQVPHPVSFRAYHPDIVEECLTLFRANCLFRNFEIKGPADRTLIYGILFISDCLNKLGSRGSQNQQEATKTLNTLALENFNIPGEPGFPLNPLFASPANRNDAGYCHCSCELICVDLLRQYLSQFRQEVAQRLIARVYADNPAAPSKWWISFKKRLFMNKSLS
jgi:actin related protein 2/3 complex, subunit 3